MLRVTEVLPESGRHDLNAVYVVCLRLEPHIVGGQVSSEEDVVQVGLGGRNVLQGGLQGPGGQITGVLPPVLSTRVSPRLAAGQSWQTTDGVATLDWGLQAVVQLEVEVGQMEDPADWDRAGGQDWRLVGRDVVNVSNVQPPVGLSRRSTGARGPDSLTTSIIFQLIGVEYKLIESLKYNGGNL